MTRTNCDKCGDTFEANDYTNWLTTKDTPLYDWGDAVCLCNVCMPKLVKLFADFMIDKPSKP